MNTTETITSLIDYLDASVSPYHCILASSERLTQAGFEKLSLTDRWQLQPGHG